MNLGGIPIVVGVLLVAYLGTFAFGAADRCFDRLTAQLHHLCRLRGRTSCAHHPSARGASALLLRSHSHVRPSRRDLELTHKEK